MKHSLSVATTIIAMAVAFVVKGQDASDGRTANADARAKVIAAIVDSMPDDVALDHPALENSAKDIHALCKENTLADLKDAFKRSRSEAARRRILLILQKLNLPESKEFFLGVLRDGKDEEEKQLAREFLGDKPKEQTGSRRKAVAAILDRMPDDVTLDQPALENRAKEIQELCKESTLADLKDAFKRSRSEAARRRILLILQKLNLPGGQEFFVGVLRGGRNDGEKELALDFLQDKPEEAAIREIAFTTVRSGGGRLKSKAHRALGSMAEKNREQVLKVLFGMANASRVGEANVFLRQAAYAALGKMPGTDTIKFFRRKLGSMADDARLAAVKALGRWRDEESLPRLAEKLVSDGDPRVRCEAARAIGVAKSEACIPQLIAGLSDGDPKVRLVALDALRKTTGQSFRGKGNWAPWWKQQQEKREQLVKMLHSDSKDVVVRAISQLSKERLGRKRIAKQIEELADSDSKPVRHAALRGLGDLGQASSIPVLLDTLGTNDSATLIEALKSLSKMTQQKEKIVKEISALATDYDDAVAAAACRALGDLRSPAGVPVLVNAIGNLEGKPLLAAIQALGNGGSGNAAAVEALAGCITDDRVEVATQACSALGKIKSRKAVPALLKALGETRRPVSLAAHRALTKITAKRLPPEQGAWAEWWATAKSK